ncbi:MAG: hypothetical protein U7M05_10465, partial [Candidatus Igneacidithiobacillus chanchocoensis]
MEKLIELLPRRWVPIRLEPRSDVAELGSGKGEFRATGKHPSFSIALTPTIARGGWFYLEAALVRHTGEREARLHGQLADGLGTTFEIPIPSNLRGTVREVFYLHGPVASLYWSPMSGPGFFSQSTLLVHKISRLESLFRRLHRVGLTLWNQRHLSAERKSELTWRSAARNLHDAYVTTARMQIQRYQGLDYSGFIARHETLRPEALLRLKAELNSSD